MTTAWRVFDLEVSRLALEAVSQHAEAQYPAEACGLIFGPNGKAVANEVVPIKNVAEQPGRFEYSGSDYLQALEEADRSGRTERVAYHSHPDAGAYLSALDRAALAPDGTALMPGVVHLVVSVRRGRAEEMAAYRWDPDQRRFEERFLAPTELPDLDLRSGPAFHPVVSVGGRLASRRLGFNESESLAPLAEGRKLQLSKTDEVLLSCLERGFLSPLAGFQRTVDVRAVEALGRTPEGVPWRVPVVLTAPKAPAWEVGQVFELDSSTGPAGLMVLSDVASTKEGFRLGGPVYAYPTASTNAQDVRARLVSADARTALMVPKAMGALLASFVSRFDAVWPGGEPDQGPAFFELGADPWLDAAIAQNQGATHILVNDSVVAQSIAASLAIQPVLAEL